MITRRRFLKWLAIGVPAMAVAPGALAANGVAVQPKWGIREPEPWKDWLTMDELQAQFKTRLDKNPLFRGELGIYQGVTLHIAK